MKEVETGVEVTNRGAPTLARVGVKLTCPMCHTAMCNLFFMCHVFHPHSLHDDEDSTATFRPIQQITHYQ